MELFITAVIAFYVGYRVNQITQIWAFKRILQELGIRDADMRRLAQRNGIELPPEPAQEPELEEIHIKLEQHQGQIYAFRVDSDGFLGQGPDREQLIARLTENLTNVRLIVDEGADLLQKNNG